MIPSQSGTVGLVRTFICVPIPDGHRKALARWIDSRRRESHEVRWVDPSTMHITLKFCGEVRQTTISAILAGLKTLAPFGGLELSISGVGGFPCLTSPKVLWAGVRGDVDKLRILQKNVENIAYSAGIEKERRPFAPHLTLGRRNSALPLPDIALRGMTEHPISMETWHADGIILMKSVLSPLGPRYTPLGLFKI